MPKPHRNPIRNDRKVQIHRIRRQRVLFGNTAVQHRKSAKETLPKTPRETSETQLPTGIRSSPLNRSLE